MPQLVVVVPLKEGAFEEAKGLLAGGPPMDLSGSDFERHEVFLTPSEVVFVFSTPEDVPAMLHVRADDPTFWRAAKAWQPLIDGRPRKAETVFSWSREG
jgi:hypothetical protein